MNKNIVLAGFGASGKTTIGRYLAARFDRQFADVDEEISKRVGYHHDKIIQQQGWEAFRAFEQTVVEDLSKLENMVIATGGGTLLNSHNRVALKNKGVLFYIDVPLDELRRRTRARLDRPVANAWTDEEFVKKYEERLSGYLLSDVTVPANGCNPEECADRLMNAIFERGFPRIPYELWFRQTYKPMIVEKSLTTAVRPGERVLPAPKGTYAGETARVRILSEPGTDNSLPRFDEYATSVLIDSIDVKKISDLLPSELLGSSPDARDSESVKYHLGLIYNRQFKNEDVVSVLKFSYGK
ncbi:MAG TPA: shikimate kinase [Candidatus Binatia bacterium]|nr:shikimate kinase [Candidatus Binatia bacterium]